MTDDELRAAAERVAVVAAEYSAAAKQIKPRTDAEGRLAGQVTALGFIASDMAAKCLDLLPPASPGSSCERGTSLRASDLRDACGRYRPAYLRRLVAGPGR